MQTGESGERSGIGDVSSTETHGSKIHSLRYKVGTECYVEELESWYMSRRTGQECLIGIG